MYNSAMGYLGKAHGNQTMEECHRTFLNLVLKGKLREAVQFVCEREKGGGLQPDELAEDPTGTINKTVTLFLEGENNSKTFPSCATLEMYKETHIFITVDIIEEAVESVARKLSRRSVPGGTYSGALQKTISKTAGKYTQDSYTAVVIEIQSECIFLQCVTWDTGDSFAGVEKMICETFFLVFSSETRKTPPPSQEL